MSLNLIVFCFAALRCKILSRTNGKFISVSQSSIVASTLVSYDSDLFVLRITFKIFANTSVAETIFESFPSFALLRIHQSVDESRFEDLKEILNARKVDFDGSSNMRLADSLKKAEKSSISNSAVNSLFKSLATR